MLICKGNKSYRCGEIHRRSVDDNMLRIRFSVLDNITPTETKELFADNKFYFYDDVLGDRLIDTDDKKLVGLFITYNADSTCNITIKLKKGVVDYEN